MPRTRRRWLGIRARVVASFLALLLLAVLALLGVLQQVGSRRINTQVDRDLSTAAADLRVRLQHVSTTLGQPGGPTLDTVFTDYLSARPARGDQAFLAIVDGRPIAASAGEPISLQGLPIAAKWATLTSSERGEVATSRGRMRWLAVPVLAGARLLGVVVATEFLSGQQAALRSTIVTVSLVMVLVLLGACLLAWGAAGRALAPVRDLAASARSVSTGADLGARVEVHGHDEVAELASSYNGMLDDLQAAFDGQTRFLDSAAHELRTPITIVRGHVELLDDDPDDRAATVALLLDEVDRMDRLVEEMRLLARSQRPDFLVTASLDVAELIEELGRKAKMLGDRTWSVRAGPNAYVRADRQRLTQAMLNLVGNAVQVTDSRDTIEIGSGVCDRDVVLWVRDSGPGIATKDLPTMFDREGRTVPRRPGGTGLGLPIVAAIAEAHRGRATVTSTLGEGSRFKISLPRTEPDAAQ